MVNYIKIEKDNVIKLKEICENEKKEMKDIINNALKEFCYNYWDLEDMQ